MSPPSNNLPPLLSVSALSVAGGYTTLGFLAITRPAITARLLGAHTSSFDRSHRLLTALLGARDLSIGAALFALAYQREWKAMGTLILSGGILCAADVIAAARGEWPFMGAVLGAGAALWMGIGVWVLGA